MTSKTQHMAEAVQQAAHKATRPSTIVPKPHNPQQFSISKLPSVESAKSYRSEVQSTTRQFKMSGVFPMPCAWDSSWDNPPASTRISDVPASTTGRPRPPDLSQRRRSGVSPSTNPPSPQVPRQPRAQNPSRRATREVSAETTSGEDFKRPIVIAVFGKTGAGKTSFIKSVTGMDLEVGHDLESCKPH